MGVAGREDGVVLTGAAREPLVETAEADVLRKAAVASRLPGSRAGLGGRA